MRINVYSQELLTDFSKEEVKKVVGPVTQTADTGRTYHGVRLFIDGSERLHNTPDDDDRSAITLWLPKSRERREAVAWALAYMSALILIAPEEE